MKEIIARVEKRGEELNDLKSAAQANASSFHKGPLEDAPGSAKDRLLHQTYEVPVGPICPFDSVPELVSSDSSMCSSKSQGEPERDISGALNVTSCIVAPSKVQLIHDAAAANETFQYLVKSSQTNGATNSNILTSVPHPSTV